MDDFCNDCDYPTHLCICDVAVYVDMREKVDVHIQNTTLNYKDLMIAMFEASDRFSCGNINNYYRGRKLEMDARKMLRMDEAVIAEANKRGWKYDQLKSWVCSKEGYEAAFNYRQDGGNGFSSFFN